MRFAPTSITMLDAPDVLREGVQAIERGVTSIDLTQLTHFDSSAVSTLLAWRRAAAQKSARLDIIGLPTGLQSLAKLYGVDAFL